MARQSTKGRQTPAPPIAGNLALRRIVLDPLRGPEAVHHFMWAGTGQEFLFEAGYIDLLELHGKDIAVKRGEKVEPVDFIVTHRFSMSPATALRLFETAKNMISSLSNHDKERGSQ